jgi:hypothetical protein
MSNTLDNYFYLCFNCGFITPYTRWEQWNWDEEGDNLIPAPEGEEAFYERCPVCLWDHWDDDSNPGIMDGKREELENERKNAIEDWGDRWKEVESEVFGL